MSDHDRAILPAVDEPTHEPETDESPGAAADAIVDDATASEENAGADEPQTVDTDEQGEPEPMPEPIDPQWAEATGAIVLGVLDPDDMAAARKAMGRSQAMQTEIARLLPIADILLSLYQTQPAAAAGESAPVVDRPLPDRTAPPVPRRVERPRREVAARPARSPMGGVTGSTILIGVLALAAVAGVLWALSLSDRIGTRDDEIAALKRQVTEFRQAANASAFSLTPSGNAAEDARGTVFYSIADSKVLIDVTGLPELDDDRVYQVWFQRSGSDEWQPGPTFLVNPDGESVQRLPGETPTFVAIAISEEPAPGSSEPSGSFLLEGALAGANG